MGAGKVLDRELYEKMFNTMYFLSNTKIKIHIRITSLLP